MVRNEVPSKGDFRVVPPGTRACVVVFHEVWGLVEHTGDVCKRIGKLGFAAVAPNLYRGYDSILTPAKIQRAMKAVWELSLEERRNREKVEQTLERKGASEDVRRAIQILYDQGFREKLLTNAVKSAELARSEFDSVATLGFCIGGGLALRVATKTNKVDSVAGFYGEPPGPEDIGRISVPALAVYAQEDEIINQKVPDFVRAMLEMGKDLTLKTYPKTKHGFFNDTRREVYDRRAAVDSWELTRWYLERTLEH